MGLRKVLDAVEARVATVVGQTGGKQPNFGLGEAAKYKSEAPPRVTWVPLQGPATVGDEQTAAVRKLWKRHLQLEVRIWCEEFEDVETLAAHVWAAFTRVHGGRYALRSEAWDTSGTLKLGVRGIFLLDVRLAFDDEPNKVVDGTGTPLGVDISTEIDQAGIQ